MKVGFDFDNTLINYYGVFFEVAYSKGLIPLNIKKDKNSVKDYLNKNSQGELFTEIQGLVYGKEILRSCPSKNILIGLNDLLKKEKKANLFIVSHKTKYPFIGEKIYLREAANRWIKSIELASSFGSKINENYMEIRYEDLVTKPEEIIKKTCDFINIVYDPEMLDHTKQVEKLGDTNKDHHSNLSKPISSDSIGKWKNNLSESDQRSITKLLSNHLQRLGYVD